jgi:hypothetical protein
MGNAAALFRDPRLLPGIVGKLRAPNAGVRASTAERRPAIEQVTPQLLLQPIINRGPKIVN